MRIPVDHPGQQASSPFSMAIETSGRLLFVSGQGPVDRASGRFIVESFEQQARLTLDNLKAAAEAGGGSLAYAVKVNAYLRDMADFPTFNEIYRQYFPEPRPARTTVQSDLAGFDIEVDAIIALDVPSGGASGPGERAG